MRSVIGRRSRELLQVSAPDSPLATGPGWEWPDLAALILFRTSPTDRALAGWDPGYWHLPEREER